MIGVLVQRLIGYCYYIYRFDNIFKDSIYQTKKWFINALYTYVSICIIIIISIIVYFGYISCYNYAIPLVMIIFRLFDLIFTVYIHAILISKLIQLLVIKNLPQISGLIRKLVILTGILIFSDMITMLGFMFNQHSLFYIILGMDLIVNNMCLMLSKIELQKMYLTCCVCCVPETSNFDSNDIIPKPANSADNSGDSGDNSDEKSLETIINAPKISSMGPNLSEASMDTCIAHGRSQTLPNKTSGVFTLPSHGLCQIPEDKPQTPQLSNVNSNNFSLNPAQESPTLTYQGIDIDAYNNQETSAINNDEITCTYTDIGELDYNDNRSMFNNSRTESYTRTFDYTRANNIKAEIPPLRQPREQEITDDNDEEIDYLKGCYSISLILATKLDVIDHDYTTKDKNIADESLRICVNNMQRIGIIY